MSVETIFAAAAQKPAADRAIYLDEACAADPDLRRKVERLLKAHDAAGEFLESPAERPAGTIDVASVPECVGSKVGAYILREQIGEGGFGLVFVAEQTEPVKRKVALKVIKPGMDSAQVIARFEAERQALALMDHPNIAKVLDAGATESGRPYFVMELVRGIPITEYCDQNQLSPRDRLELFVTVCQAIQHAHQKGIIHRDIKPSNVLVTSHDGRPVAKVIDFGVAKAIHQHLTERTIYTNFAQMIGTPLYMSPEQAEMSGLDIDTRSDIYSLGVLLYELLTGTTPLEKKRLQEAAYDEIRRLIREEEPPKPSTRLSHSGESLPSVAAQRKTEPAKLSKLMRGDLDWITMKALEKDRTRRYETATGLARDVQRYLSDEPVEASPPKTAYRIQKFIRRNKGRVTAASLVLLALLGGIIGTTIGLIRAARARDEEAKQRAVADEQRASAVAERNAKDAALSAETKARAQTRDALNALTDDVVENLLAKQPTLGSDEKAFLRKVLGFYEAVAAEGGETKEARQVAADGQFRVAKLQAFLGERKGAISGYRRALVLFGKLAGDFPTDASFRRQLSSCHNTLGAELAKLSEIPEAEKQFRESLAIDEKLAAEFPELPVYRFSLAKSLANLAHALRYLDIDSQPAIEAYYRRAVAIDEQLVVENPSKAAYRSDLATLQGNLGSLLRELGRFPEADSAYRRAIALQEKLTEDFPAVPSYRIELARSLTNLGLLLVKQEKFSEAELGYRQAMAYQDKLAADFPVVQTYRTELAGNYVNFGQLLCARKQSAEALNWLDKAIPILEANLARDRHLLMDRWFLRNAHWRRAEALTDLHRYAEAVMDWDLAIELDPGPDRPKCRLPRALCLARAGDHVKAADEASALAVRGGVSAAELYDCARVFVLCSAASTSDAALRAKYADQATLLLTKAVAAGLKDAAHLKKDADFDALREREDFKKLVAELEANAQPKSP